MSKKVKVAIVGCGVISYNHLFSLVELDDVEITALCDVIPEKAQKRKEEFSLDSKIYTDYNTLLKSEKLDAIHICTPHHLHASMTTDALKYGINVFLEKPMCISCEEIEEILEAEKESTAKVCVCFQNRFTTALTYAKELVKKDGGIFAAYGTVFWYRDAEYYREDDWRGKYATEGGGVMINQAIHTLDMLCQLIGEPKSVIATTSNHHLKGVIEVEDTCEGIIKFKSGAEANFYATTAFKGDLPITVMMKTNKENIIELRGLKLFFNDKEIDFSKEPRFIGKRCYGNAHPVIISEFYSAIKTGSEMPVTAESAQYALRILLAAYKSNNNEIFI